MNALEIIQQGAVTLGLEKPATIEDSLDSNAQRLLGQLNRAIEEILLDYDWQELIKRAIFTADRKTHYNDKLKGYNISKIAPGFAYFITQFIYDRKQNRPINSITPDQYSAASLGQNGVQSRFFIQNGHICFMPEIALDSVLEFFYKSKFGIYYQNVSGDIEQKEFFTADADESIIDGRLLLRGLIWKFKNEIGVDYAESYRDYQLYLGKLKDQDSNRRFITSNNLNGNIPHSNIGI